MRENIDLHISRREFLKMLGQGLGLLALGVWVKDAFKLVDVDEAVQAADAKVMYRAKKTPTPTLTRRPLATNTSTPTTRPTSTPRIRKPTVSPTMKPTRKPTITNSPVFTRVPTSTVTSTPTMTSTPDLTGYIIPTPDNFEELIVHLAYAINRENVRQEGKDEVDPTDLVEDYSNFSREKYNEYKKGQRPYKYLNFREFRRGNLLTGKIYVQATVKVPNSSDGSSEKEYLSGILDYLKNQLKIAVANIDEKQRTQIERDIAESDRLTCVKSTRFVWDIFGDYYKNGLGLFPAIFQLQIVNAGELAFQVDRGTNIFAPEKIAHTYASTVAGANIIATYPEDNPVEFDGKIMIFFRPQMVDGEPGHVGICKLKVEYDETGKFKDMLVTFIEVDGNTGQAYYAYRADLDDFRTHLYMNTPQSDGLSHYLVGWLYNREQNGGTASKGEEKKKK